VRLRHGLANKFRRGQTVWIIASALASIMKAKIVIQTALHTIAQNPKASLRSLFIFDYGTLDYVQRNVKNWTEPDPKS
jgi:hypothetical protein